MISIRSRLSCLLLSLPLFFVSTIFHTCRDQPNGPTKTQVILPSHITFDMHRHSTRHPSCKSVNELEHACIHAFHSQTPR